MAKEWTGTGTGLIWSKLDGIAEDGPALIITNGDLGSRLPDGSIIFSICNRAPEGGGYAGYAGDGGEDDWVGQGFVQQVIRQMGDGGLLSDEDRFLIEAGRLDGGRIMYASGFTGEEAERLSFAAEGIVEFVRSGATGIDDSQFFLAIIMPDGSLVPVAHYCIICLPSDGKVVTAGVISDKAMSYRAYCAVCAMYGMKMQQDIARELCLIDAGMPPDGKIGMVSDRLFSGEALISVEGKEDLERFLESSGLFADPLPDAAFTFYHHFQIKNGSDKLVPVRPNDRQASWDVVYRASDLSDMYDAFYDEMCYEDIGLTEAEDILRENARPHAAMAPAGGAEAPREAPKGADGKGTEGMAPQRPILATMWTLAVQAIKQGGQLECGEDEQAAACREATEDGGMAADYYKAALLAMEKAEEAGEEKGHIAYSGRRYALTDGDIRLIATEACAIVNARTAMKEVPAAVQVKGPETVVQDMFANLLRTTGFKKVMPAIIHSADIAAFSYCSGALLGQLPKHSEKYRSYYYDLASACPGFYRLWGTPCGEGDVLAEMEWIWRLDARLDRMLRLSDEGAPEQVLQDEKGLIFQSLLPFTANAVGKLEQ